MAIAFCCLISTLSLLLALGTESKNLRNETFCDHPLPYRIIVDELQFKRSMSWHRVSKLNQKSFVFSAFLDSRFGRASVLILGLTASRPHLDSGLSTLYCRVWTSDQQLQLVVKADVSTFNNRTKSGYYETAYKCLLDDTSDVKPYYVSLVEDACEKPHFAMVIAYADGSKKPEEKDRGRAWLGHLPDIFGPSFAPKTKLQKKTLELFRRVTSRIPAHEFVKLTVCSPSLLTDDYPVEFVLEWIELNREMGVERFVMFKASKQTGRFRFKGSSSNAKKLVSLLGYYEKLGVVRVYEWSLPVEMARNGIGSFMFEGDYILGIDLSLTFCLYANLHSSAYLANLALDEYFVATANSSSMIHFIDGHEVRAGLFSFCNQFHLIFDHLRLEWKRSHAFPLKSMILVRRLSESFCRHKKYIVRASVASWMRLFDAQLVEGHEKVEVNTEDASLRSFLLLTTKLIHQISPADEYDDVSLVSHVTYAMNLLIPDDVTEDSSDDEEEGKPVLDVENSGIDLDPARNVDGGEEKALESWLSSSVVKDALMLRYEGRLLSRVLVISVASGM